MLRTILLTCCLVLWPQQLLSSSDDLPDLGSPASLILSPQDEMDLARSVLSELNQTLRVSQDPVLNDYLSSIGYRIVSTHRTHPRKYTFFAVEDPSINAFAIPGGMIGVNTGLILASQTESELAGVMAHEVAHVHLRHIARFIEHMGRVRISNIAGIIASIILATQNPQAGSGALAATMAGSTQSLINFTRENEKEADLVGIQSLAEAGFDPRGMPQFFQHLGEKTRYVGREIPEYLRTHPLTESRMMEASRRAQKFPYKQVPDSLQFHLIQARVQLAQFQNPHLAAEHFESVIKDKNYKSKQGAEYGYALALTEARNPKALEVIESLIKQNPNQALYQLAKAEALWQQNKTTDSTQTLELTLKNHPLNHPATMSLASKYIHLGMNKPAITLLHQQRLEHDVPVVYHFLAKAYSAENDQASSHQMQAEYRYQLGDLYGAVTQLRMAQQFTTSDSSQSQKIGARKSELEKIIARTLN